MEGRRHFFPLTVWLSKTPLSQRLSAGKQIKQGVFELISHYNSTSNFTSKCRALCFQLNIVASPSPSLQVSRAPFVQEAYFTET